MKLKLDVPYVVTDEARKDPNAWSRSDREITVFFIRSAIHKKFGDKGAKKGAERRINGGLQKKLTLALKAQQDDVEVDGHEFRLVRDALAEWEAPAFNDWHSWLTDLDDMIAAAERELEAAEKASKQTEKK